MVKNLTKKLICGEKVGMQINFLSQNSSVEDSYFTQAEVRENKRFTR